MGWESAQAEYITLSASTGLRKHRFVKMSSTGLDRVKYPNASTVGEAILGVLVSDGTTGSTSDPTKGATIQVSGVAKVEAEASTLAIGARVSASSLGRVQSTTNAGDFCVGTIVWGSSGAANRLVGVLLQPIGSTVAV